MKFIGTDVNRDVKLEMLDSLPKYYDNFVEVENIMTVESTELETFNNDITDVLAQFYIDTANWGLAYWERICAIKTEESKPLDERRSNIKARLRGIGTVTVEMIKNVAESWYGGEVEVIETPSQYLVTIEFVSSYGVPNNLADVEKALRDIIPAHLGLAFEFRYLTYDGLKAYGLAYDGLIATGYTYAEVLTNGE